MAKELLSVTQLEVGFDTDNGLARVLDNVNFEIMPGEIVGLVGESGCGKTTLARAILGVLPRNSARISSGSIQFEGKDLLKLSSAELATNIRGKLITFIPQDPLSSFNPVFTIGAQMMELMKWKSPDRPPIKMFMRYDKARKASDRTRILDLLQTVQLPDPEGILRKYPHEVSGGQRQRLMIAMALLPEPRMIIADEPTTALDVTIQAQILELIKTLTKERNLAVILITHDMGVISETTNRVAVMKNGDLVEIGPTKEILTKPKEIYTKALVSSVPPTNKKIDRFKIIEKENKTQGETNIKILNRWTKKEIIDQDLVKVKNLSKTFDDNFFTESTKNSVMAVDDVSFNIKEGESFGLVGESGSGKSTIAKMIVNLYSPSAGDIDFDNVCITKIKSNKEMMKFRKQIQMIFQDPYSSLNGRLKVRDIVSEPIKLHNPLISKNDLDSYVFDLLESVELTQNSADRYPHEFSGGQRQRISIARALATQPRLLVCDEPTSALDVSIQAQILNLLKDLQEQLNLTILFISHDLPVVRQMCDRIGVLRDGKLCEISDTEDLFLKPQHDYTKELLHLMPKIESIYN